MGPDGSFTIPDVPTILGDIFVVALGEVVGIPVEATSGSFASVDAGETDVGTVFLIGGHGTNELFAWTFDPNPVVTQWRFRNRQTVTADGGATVLRALAPTRDVAVLRRDARFGLSLDGGPFVEVNVAVTDTEGNSTLGQLVFDIQTALDGTELVGLVTAGVDNGVLVFTSNSESLTIDTGHFGVANPTEEEHGALSPSLSLSL